MERNFSDIVKQPNGGAFNTPSNKKKKQRQNIFGQVPEDEEEKKVSHNDQRVKSSFKQKNKVGSSDHNLPSSNKSNYSCYSSI